MKQFSEATRVQMPAMVHLTRIGYTYFYCCPVKLF